MQNFYSVREYETFIFSFTTLYLPPPHDPFLPLQHSFACYACSSRQELPLDRKSSAPLPSVNSISMYFEGTKKVRSKSVMKDRERERERERAKESERERKREKEKEREREKERKTKKLINKRDYEKPNESSPVLPACLASSLSRS